MREYRADLHIHTVLSPCGYLTMSPANIIEAAERRGIQIIGITDHNSTRHCRMVSKMAAARNIFVMMGAEVTTKEEVHCLTFFENAETLDKFQDFLARNLPDVKNIPEYFGDQVVIDEDEIITGTEERLLTNALDVSIDEIEAEVHRLGGLFIPAHIDRIKNSIYSQLGVFPEGLKADALEVSFINSREKFLENHMEIAGYGLITSSDAHFPEHVGRSSTIFRIETPGFGEIAMALAGKGGRRITG